MKRNVRRLWSVLLALVMLVSLFGGTMLTAQAQGETITVYLDAQNSDWEQGYVYWWGASDETTWPGIKMVYENGSAIFSAEIPADATGVVFNNGNGKQSTDLHDPENRDLYVVGAEDWYPATCNHEYDSGICIRCGAKDPDIPEEYTVYFDNTFMQYENVYAQWYSNADGEYYSTEMTHVDGNIYAAQLPADTIMWFSNGEISTSLADVVGDYLFVKDGVWLPYHGCIHEWDDGDMGSGFLCTSGGICLYTCQICGQCFDEGRAPAEHNVVDGVCTECGQTGEATEFSYEISNGQVTIIDVVQDVTGKLVIPETFEGYPVTAIGGNAFCGLDLTEVTIPDSVTIIEDQAFMACEKLTKVTISNGLTEIGASAFEGCCSLEKITIPQSVTRIGKQAFLGCMELSDVVIPEGVTSIGECAFGCCWNLTEVTIPASVTTIGRRPFFECLSLKKIQVAQGNAYYCNDEYGVLFNKNKTQLIQAPIAGMQGAYSVPDGVTTIGKLAFYHCTSLTELTFPEGLTTIEDSGCYYTGVAEVMIPDTVTTIEESGFGYNENLKNIYFCGDAPAFGINIFMYAHANVYYHEGTKGWPAQIKDMYDTQLLWKEAHIYADGECCVVCGEPSSTTTGLVKLDDGWYYYQNGVPSQTTGLVKYNNEWWYVVGGKLADHTTTLVKWGGEWWYVVKGKIASKTTGLVKYNNEWWYVVGGKVASKTTTLVKYNNEWWYVVGGKVASKTTSLVKYNNEWWYVVKGKIAAKTTALVKYNGGWYYIYKGKLAAKTTTLVKYNGGWYYVNKGSVDWGYTGNFVFNGGTYRIVKGRVA